MGWDQVPEFDSSSSTQDDNPFAGAKSHIPGKVSVKVLVDDWLCRKFEKLNITVQEGYPSQASETAGLVRDQFVKSQGLLNGTTCTLIRRTSPDQRFFPGLTNRHASTAVFLALPIVLCLLLQPPDLYRRTH